MPVSPTYPGVYVEEIPSSVRTIVGVSTSVTAFVGSAKFGPLDKATRVLSWGDYEKRFGGLDRDSEMSYAVSQFFLNGGGEGWIVRVAKGAVAASTELLNSNGDKVLVLTALDSGAAGNSIFVRVDYETSNPGSTFNLFLTRRGPTGAEEASEEFRNLSLNDTDERYAEEVLKSSTLVSAKRSAGAAAVVAADKGTSTSGDLTGTADFTKLRDDAHDTFRISIDGGPPIDVVIDAFATNTLVGLRTAINAKLPGGVAISGTAATGRLKLTSASSGQASTVRVLPGITRDIASRLLFGPLFGGAEVDAAAGIRPAEAPTKGDLTSGASPDFTTTPSATKQSMRVVLNGLAADITIDPPALTVGSELTDLAARIQAKVRAARATNPAFSGFTAAESSGKLVLTSGLGGTASSVVVRPIGTDTLATDLKLTVPPGAATLGADLPLTGGMEGTLTPADIYNAFIADRSKRKGIFALEGVDLFNLLVLAGVTDTGVLMDGAAYCEERRAFLIADSPINGTTSTAVDDMEQSISGTALPKSKNAAVYFPWVRIADPLRGGRLRLSPPSGTIAGLFARTDANRGVWKAPAGTEATLTGVQAVEYVLTDRENGVLNPRGANCLRTFPVFGAVSWGARTLRGDDQMADEWKYVPVRRLALFLEESLYRGTKWAVFEPNDEPLWAQIRLNIGAFMNSLFRQGAFAGQTPREAYLVKCDRETTTQDDVNRGIVNVLVGFAPLKPAEFVILRFQQLAGQLRT